MLKRLIATFMFIGFAVAAQAETLRVHSPGDGFLNLRTGPGGDYAIIMQMDHGSYLDTLETAGNWVRVRHESGATGWAYRKHMRNLPAQSNERSVYSPGDGFLNLRTGPGSSFAIVRRMYHGDSVYLGERKGNWVFVQHASGAKGWAYSKYLR